MRRIFVFSIVTLMAVSALLLNSCREKPVLQGFEFKGDTLVVGTSVAELRVMYSFPVKLSRAEGFLSQKIDMYEPIVVQAEISETEFVIRFNSLEPNTQYFYQYEYSNNFDLNEITPVRSFRTNDSSEPIVTTSDIYNITVQTATGGGNVIDAGGGSVLMRGLCWSTDHNPEYNDYDSNVTDFSMTGFGTGSFTLDLTGLTANTTYYVRAFAVNEVGIGYGSEKSFTTNDGSSPNTPEGALNGLFSVSSLKQVYFSRGNLQYRASANTWRFAENQWDCIKGSNVNVSPTNDDWIDLFTWATSGYDHGANCYQPWSTSTVSSDYYAYGDFTYNLYDQTGQADWGYNAISNGGNTENMWHTLTRAEWIYIIDSRMTPSGARFAKARVNGTNGLILLPDDWSSSTYNLNSVNVGEAGYEDNVIIASVWTSVLEPAGAVFLPAGGGRIGYTIGDAGTKALYWSASSYDQECAYGPNIEDSYVSAGDYVVYRYIGRSVRLVKNAEAATGVPTVNTSEVNGVTATTATCGGNVTNDGGQPVTERGVCWSTSPQPTTSDSKVSGGSGTGVFMSNLTGLSPNTTYYVRAYATNSLGTGYGAQKMFTTTANTSVPEGAINAQFSVSETKKVYFSKGNLQYQASTQTWKFAEEQYYYCANDNGNISSTYSGWIDLFGWGTGNNPTNTSTNSGNYSTFNDWGNNAISNGGNTANVWRTLTRDEWDYLMFHRTTTSGVRYALAQVGDANGLILVPDNWSGSNFGLTLNQPNQTGCYCNNVFDVDSWNLLAGTGLVFLPAAGGWENGPLVGINSNGEYWSSSTDYGTALHAWFHEGGIGTDSGHPNSYRKAVRLVFEAN